ncbi:small multi-drug export protein [Patescibacteria group bacterium]|nr:small multi-drug export protein [Patescibacteria group bacterium]
MLDSIIQFLNQFPPALSTIILAALPITELRLSIPVAVHVWLVPPLTALGLSLVGNFLPFFPLYYGLDALRRSSVKYMPWLTKMIDRSIDRAERRLKQKYARYGAFALFLFTALPLPFTGLWTATLAAVALKIPLKYTLAGIVSGIFVAGIIVTILSVSVDFLMLD